MKKILLFLVCFNISFIVSSAQSVYNRNINLARNGNPQAQFEIGKCFFNGDGIQKDYQQAVSWFRKSGEQGFPPAQNILGICYMNGTGVKQDYVLAFNWWKKAAEQGLADAQCDLGSCYANGVGISQDVIKAEYWWKKAAAKGDELAVKNLELWKEEIERAKKNSSTQSVYSRNINLAQKGNPQAQFEIGKCFFTGDGIQKDYQQAVSWFRKSGEQGFPPAQNILGICYMNGTGVKQDYVLAFNWWKKAAEQGLADAQCDLGSCYANGVGVSQDVIKAEYWWKKAAAKGDELAVKNLEFWKEEIERAKKNTTNHRH